MSGGDTWSILFVCTGNICRSPMAERLTRAAFEARLGPAADAAFAVSSAGTHGLEGEPMEPYARRTLAERGADPDGFVARRLTGRMVEEADLVLCATRTHRSDVVTLSPRALKRCFTIVEFGRLTAGLPPGGAGAGSLRTAATDLVAQAIAGRGRYAAERPSDDDILDPHLQGLDDFRDCARRIADSLSGPLDRLAAAVPDADRAGAETA